MQERKKILVTGGCGFIGSHTVLSLVNNGYEPVIVDSLENSEAFIHETLEELTCVPIRFYQANSCDEKAMADLFASERFDGVIHFAAYKAVGESVEKPLTYYANNI